MKLTGKQRRYLRGLAHHLNPVVLVGTKGFTDPLYDKIDEELENHELIKVRLGENAPMKAKQAAPLLAERTKSAVAQVIGKLVVLYRPRKEEPEIVLP